jgi:hypothetical protein
MASCPARRGDPVEARQAWFAADSLATGLVPGRSSGLDRKAPAIGRRWRFGPSARAPRSAHRPASTPSAYLRSARGAAGFLRRSVAPFARQGGGAAVSAKRPSSSDALMKTARSSPSDSRNELRRIHQSIAIFLVDAAAFFGKTSSSTPFVYLAEVFASSTAWGRVKARYCLPL